MLDATPLLRLYARYRLNRLAALDPFESQRLSLLRMVRMARATQFGRDHRFSGIVDVASYQARVPVRHYEDFWRDYWQPAFPVIRDVSWPGSVPYFAVTSGTTTGRSKYIPVTQAMLRSNAKAGADLYVFHLRANLDSQILAGRSFMLGGSTDLVDEAPGVHSGDLSGITVAQMPWFARPRYFPPADMALLEDWEEKVERLAAHSPSQDIRMISGVPSWLLLFFERSMAMHQASDLKSIYPNLELLVHGGVNFAPYRQRFDQLGAGISCREVYPASEGFVAVADADAAAGLRLSLDHGIFFEFVPVAELDRPSPTRHWLGNAETGVDYAILLTTCAGIWSYVLGDTVVFTDEGKRHIRITGRTAQMLSAFGEHVIVSELDAAITAAARASGGAVTDYTVGAVVPESGAVRGHHLVIAERAAAAPLDPSRFSGVFDSVLQEANEDYRAHRAAGFGLDAPKIVVAAPGTFAAWMKARRKLGGQNKVPRVVNDADLMRGIRDFTEQFGQAAESDRE